VERFAQPTAASPFVIRIITAAGDIVLMHQIRRSRS